MKKRWVVTVRHRYTGDVYQTEQFWTRRGAAEFQMLAMGVPYLTAALERAR